MSPSSKKVIVFGRKRCVHVHRGKEIVMISIKEAKELEKKLLVNKSHQRGGADDKDALDKKNTAELTERSWRAPVTKKRLSKKKQQEEEARRTGDVFEF